MSRISVLIVLMAVSLAVLQGCGEDSGDGDGGNDSGGSDSDPGYEGDAPGECVDRADNDQDGLFDCQDEGCANSPDCDTSTDSGSQNTDSSNTDTNTQTTDTGTQNSDTNTQNTDTGTQTGDTNTQNTDTGTGNADTTTYTEIDSGTGVVDTDTDSVDNGEDTAAGPWDTALWDDEADTEPASFEGQKFRGVHVIDQNVLMIHFMDGEVIFDEITEGDGAYSNNHELSPGTVVNYGAALDTGAATTADSWRISSSSDTNFGSSGIHPADCFRKSKISGMQQGPWVGSDYTYETTMEHWIYLELPSPLQQGNSYTVEIDSATNTDVEEYTFTYDIYSSRSEAVHVNLAGYHPSSAIHAADLYHWLGDGGARDYSDFAGNAVYLFNVETETSVEVGEVAFHMDSANEFWDHDLIESGVWTADFTGTYEPGIYRLAIEGVGASQDFVIGESAVYEPFKVSTLGFFYMRIGQDNLDMTPVPRRPLWIPGEDPADCTVVVTDMDPYHPDWSGGGDRWDSPDFFSNYVKSGSPENPNAKGGHSDALDWDRHLGHVAIIYDMLLPYILTDGIIGSDSLGIAESGNGVPDIIDEAQNEVDFWLSLRYEGGYSHGLSNPDGNTHILYQADNTALAAWANAINAAMLSAALEVANKQAMAKEYLQAALEAWNYAGGLSDKMLDDAQGLGTGDLTGRDLRMTAAAWLYHLTGNTDFENIMANDSMVTSGTSEFWNDDNSQLYGIAAYLHTDQVIHFPELQNNMRDAVIYQAKEKEVRYTEERASRRASDQRNGWFHTCQNVHRTILAHSVATDESDLAAFERAMVLEADWGLGRNPANVVQMTTATTRMESLRSVTEAYTSGWNDGTPGVHPGHTPYLNIHDWGGLTMGTPSYLTNQLYPSVGSWPDGELVMNIRQVYAYSEFTPQQTMRGKMALYGYLLGMTR